MSHWQGKVIVVTGGATGLGYAIAEAFAHEGGTLVLVSRTEASLQIACERSKHDLQFVVGDVCDDDSVQAIIEDIKERFGRIDIWVNNVGQSIRIDFNTCTIDDYIRLMEINFYSAVRCTMAALPLLQASSGSVVNIGTLASKTAWKHVAPYAASKHALAAFSHQIRLEGPDNVHCLFVCPGPISRDDADHRYQEQARSLGESANRAGAGVRLSGIDPAVLAAKIESATRRRKKEIVVPFKARILFAIQQLSPTIGDWILRRFSRSK